MNKTVQRVNAPRAAKTNAATINSINSINTNTAHPPMPLGAWNEYSATPATHPIWQVPTPSLILSPHRAVDNFKAIQRAFPGANVGYAMKSNPHPSLLSALANVDGAWFEVASKAEIQALLDIGVTGERIFFSNPVKQPAHIAFAVKHGIKLFVFDSEAEIEKLAQHNNPDDPLEVYVRMTVSHEGALWPLTHKFGVQPRRAVDLLRLAKARGLKPVGLAFHVGSQCTRPDTWADALREISPAWRMAAEEGIHLDMIDLGGGFPAPYTGPVPHAGEIADAVKQVMDECVPGATRVFLEPGRGVCGNAADMVLEVTGVAQRPDGQLWLYLDGGFFSGLYEIPDGIRPSVQPIVRESRPLGMVTYRLAGPTCDSLDTLFEMRSPVELNVGDRLVMKTAGAYIYSVSSPFNGFATPEMLHEDEWMMRIDDFRGIC
jgi:ornithine decarboxylase